MAALKSYIHIDPTERIVIECNKTVRQFHQQLAVGVVPNSHFWKPISLDIAIRQLLHWNRDLSTSERIQTAFIAVLNNTNFTPHWHVLMLGKNKNGRTLLDVSERKWERKWPGIVRIEVVRHNQAVSKYLARNMTFWNSDQYELLVYNKKLLNKYRRAR
jgi:hypothetical protein